MCFGDKGFDEYFEQNNEEKRSKQTKHDTKFHVYVVSVVVNE